MRRFLAVIVVATLCLAGQAAAAPTFSCTANAVTTQMNGKSKLNPVTAGGDNKACQAAVAQSGTTPLYNWFAVGNRSGATSGGTVGFIPDGKLCSASGTSWPRRSKGSWQAGSWTSRRASPRTRRWKS